MINIKFECDATITIKGDFQFFVATQHLHLLSDIAQLPKPIRVIIEKNDGTAIVEPRNISCHDLVEKIVKTWESQGFKVKVVVND